VFAHKLTNFSVVVVAAGAGVGCAEVVALATARKRRASCFFILNFREVLPPQARK
jgi:hypothetical protein